MLPLASQTVRSRSGCQSSHIAVALRNFVSFEPMLYAGLTDCILRYHPQHWTAGLSVGGAAVGNENFAPGDGKQ